MTYNNQDFFILVEFDTLLFIQLGFAKLTEGIWHASGESDIVYRVAPARPEIKQKRHIAIAHKKHTNAKNKQVSWNDDGSRHDRKSFNSNFTGMKKAEKIARDVLTIDPDVKLEYLTGNKFDLLVESILDRDVEIPFGCELIRLEATVED